MIVTSKKFFHSEAADGIIYVVYTENCQCVDAFRHLDFFLAHSGFLFRQLTGAPTHIAAQCMAQRGDTRSLLAYFPPVVVVACEPFACLFNYHLSISRIRVFLFISQFFFLRLKKFYKMEKILIYCCNNPCWHPSNARKHSIILSIHCTLTRPPFTFAVGALPPCVWCVPNSPTAFFVVPDLLG